MRNFLKDVNKVMENLRVFKNQDILEAIKILDFVRVNLANIGRMDLSNEKSIEKFLLTENLFIHDTELFKKISKVWRILVDNYNENEEDELDELVGTVDKWDFPTSINNDELKNTIIKKISN